MFKKIINVQRRGSDSLQIKKGCESYSNWKWAELLWKRIKKVSVSYPTLAIKLETKHKLAVWAPRISCGDKYLQRMIHSIVY